MVRSRSTGAVLTAVLLLMSAPHARSAAGPAPEARAKAYLTDLWRSNGAPGISVAVALKGRLVFSEGAGFADLENMVPATGSTIYNVGSVSKAMTAVAIMQLVEEGKVRLDDSIRTYVPALPDKGALITIRHIMTHSSGIRHYRSTDFPDSEDNENVRPFRSFEQAIALFKDDPLLFTPGEYRFYSSYAVNLLQGVVEKASGLGFEEYMRRHVWSPVGMFASGFDVPARIVPHRARGYYVVDGRTTNNPYGDLTYKFASGGMISSANDLVRLGMALNEGRLLKPDTVALMYRPAGPSMQFQQDGAPRPADQSQALIWNTRKDAKGRRMVFHCGTVQGFNACLVNYVDQDLVISILGNGYPVNPARNEIAILADIFLGS